MFSSRARISGRFAFRLVHARNLILWLIIAGVFAGRVIGAAADTSKAEADRLIASAVQAELSGDISRSFSLLHDAVRVDPENRLARWQLGEIQLANQWMSAEGAQRRASVDPRQTEYRERRIACGESPQGQ